MTKPLTARTTASLYAELCRLDRGLYETKEAHTVACARRAAVESELLRRARLGDPHPALRDPIPAWMRR
jgi:hypothetical protein